MPNYYVGIEVCAITKNIAAQQPATKNTLIKSHNCRLDYT